MINKNVYITQLRRINKKNNKQTDPTEKNPIGDAKPFFARTVLGLTWLNVPEFYVHALRVKPYFRQLGFSTNRGVFTSNFKPSPPFVSL